MSERCVFEINPDKPTHVRCVRGGCNRELRVVEGVPLDRYHAACKGTGPGIAQKAVNFAKAAAKHVTSGMEMVSDQQAEKRSAICLGCNLFVQDPRHPDTGYTQLGGYCCHKKCGCQTLSTKEFLAKQRWKDSKCPHPKGDKWQMTDEELNACGHPDKEMT